MEIKLATSENSVDDKRIEQWIFEGIISEELSPKIFDRILCVKFNFTCALLLVLEEKPF